MADSVYHSLGEMMTGSVAEEAEPTAATVGGAVPVILSKTAEPQGQELPPAVPAPRPMPIVVPPPNSEAVVAGGLAMKRRNPWAVWLGLPIITLGIYFYVWYYQIHKEMAKFDRRRSVPVAGPVLVVLLLGWTVIAPLISFHNAGARVRDAQRSAGLQPTCSPTLSWVLAFALGLNSFYLQVELNKVVDRYAGAPAGTQIPLYV